MIQRLTFLCLPFLASCALPGDSAWSGAHVNAFGGMVLMSAEGSADEISVPDSTLGNLEGSLEFEKAEESSLYYGARIGFAPFELIFSDFGFSAEHPSSLTGLFEGAPVIDLDTTTDLDLSVRKAMIGIDILNTGVFRLGLLGGVDELAFSSFGITDINTGRRQALLDDEQALVPMVGVRADLDLPLDIRLGGELTGIQVDVDEISVSYFDLDANLNYAITNSIELLVGYRAIELDVDGSFDEASLNTAIEFGGPYAALGIKF